jgi:hypothetical protein
LLFSVLLLLLLLLLLPCHAALQQWQLLHPQHCPAFDRYHHLCLLI